tara:strand:- start:3328 stop:3513 length:186 start_codon:yes stop_codon:yes gene_type:complete
MKSIFITLAFGLLGVRLSVGLGQQTSNHFIQLLHPKLEMGDTHWLANKSIEVDEMQKNKNL